MNTNTTQDATPNAITAVMESSLTAILQQTFSHIEDNPVTMSSLEIAKLTGKRHDNVMKDIRQQLEELGQDALEFQGNYQDFYNRSKPCFNLPRREVDILLSGYNTKMRAAVIDRWHVLEAEKKLGVIEIPNNLVGTLKLVLTLKEEQTMLTQQVEALEQQLAEDSEKVDFYNKIYERDDLLNPTKAAKLFGTGRSRYLQYLRDHKILMSRPHQQNMPYQKYLDAGYFEVKECGCYNDKTGKREFKALALLTGKGLIWLQQFIEKNGRIGL
ncbi:MAG: phage antirepressor KilAC domain-containing protein [Pseudomonas sp.]|uniref:phage antirepressor KilAC domain-containing protein n=1 Tax=Pseudomonas TaxID=286 RepID=UPI00130E201E|nr:phage regulatory protein/antirepressor Ant [Pseudomonas sp. VLB120]